MKIGLIAVDSKYPNLALMKISAYHKSIGDNVEWYNPFDKYDIVYMAKVFTFTPDYGYYINSEKIIKGGTGYDIHSHLDSEMEYIQPDYSIYNIDSNLAYGFLTRGCPNHCKWCVVPDKEGNVKPYMDIEQIASSQRDHVILMDNNILSSDYGIKQIEKIIKMGIRVDFNQGLDARLVTPYIANLLSKVKWIKYIRFGCDTKNQIEYCDKALEMIDSYGYKGEYFFYCILINDFKECYNRVNHWKEKGKRYNPFCQPYRDLENKNHIIPQWQKDLAGWTNKRWIYRSCDFKDFEPRKGFKCISYFNESINKEEDKRQLNLFRND